MKKVRLGIIGCGGMMKHHVRTIQEVENMEVTAVCDVILENAQNVASVLNNPYITTDYKTMVDHVDAVLVVLPHDLHFECGMFFARHKIHILMEKPLCNTEEECIKLIETCEEEGVKLQCAYPLRWYTGFHKLKEFINSGEYGKVMQLSVWTEQLTLCQDDKDVVHWGATARLGGGQFFSHGCHYIDLMLWLLGDPVEGSHLGTTVGTPWLLREGTSAAILKFESGALAYHGATWGARGTSLGSLIQIQTEKGMLEYDWRRSNKIYLYDRETVHQPGEVQEWQGRKVVYEFERDPYLKQTHLETAHFVDCILNDKRPAPDGRDALQSLRIIWKMYDAEKQGIIADLRGLGLEKRDTQ